MIQNGIFNLLSTNGSIAALIGSNPARIFPVLLPQDSVLPALTYHLVAEPVDPTFTTSGMARARIQFDAWGDSYSDAASLRAALTTVLHGLKGTLSDGTIVDNTLLLGATDFFEDDPRQFRCMSEFYMWTTSVAM